MCAVTECRSVHKKERTQFRSKTPTITFQHSNLVWSTLRSVSWWDCCQCRDGREAEKQRSTCMVQSDNSLYLYLYSIVMPSDCTKTIYVSISKTLYSCFSCKTWSIKSQAVFLDVIYINWPLVPFLNHKEFRLFQWHLLCWSELSISQCHMLQVGEAACCSLQGRKTIA